MRRATRVFLLSLAILLGLSGVSAAQVAPPLDLPADVLPPETPVDDPPAEPPTAEAQSSAATPLVGTFRLTAGSCSGAVTGSYFRMIQPGGSAAGPFVSNSDSPCGDKAYTPLRPGSDGGLITGGYQAQPQPPFDGAGNGRSARITAPQKFYGVDFATATNPTDPQTGVKVAAPEIRVDGRTLSGDLRAFAAAWNNQHFNQGAPKPDGGTPGITKRPSGTIDPETGGFTLEWTSLIVGGPFNNFTGVWRLEGTFVSSEAAPPGSSGGAAATGTADPGLTAAVAASSRSGTGTRERGLADTGAGPESIAGAVLLLGALAAARLRRRVGAEPSDG